MAQKGLRNYLEIGVFNGHIFFKIKSGFKLAVDPKFRFDIWRKLGKILTNPFNIFNRYFQKTSDDFFKEDAATVLADKKIELSLIDGMHEYEYALRDVENTLEFLNDDGVIVLHDCNPTTAAEASSFNEWKAASFKGVWNGDVWKTILHLRCLRPDVTTFVLDCDHGLGIVVKKPGEMLSYTKEQIRDFTYDDFTKNKKQWLNLQSPDYFYEYFGLTK